MNARSKRGEQTRLRIIRVAFDLFHKQGVHATSPDEIIEASGTGKSQLYHYFKNKEGLVHAVLHNHLEAIKLGAGPVSYEITSWRDLEQWFLVQLELQRSFGMTRGCPLGTLANEVTEKDELIRVDLSLIFEVIKNKLAAFFGTERAKGRLSKDADVDRMADFCIATIQGAMLMGKISRDGRRAEAIVREALAHLERCRVEP